jgi:Calcineurin-like phosphoesterase
VTQKNLPRIISPNLGCPLILSLPQMEKDGITVILGLPSKDSHWDKLHIHAVPSYEKEGTDFALELSNPRELTDARLPQSFSDVLETRLLISSTLSQGIFEGQARFWSFRLRAKAPLNQSCYRTAGGTVRNTLYDLTLSLGNGVCHIAPHALCLRPESLEVRFIHLTDLHVATRNDIWEKEVNCTVVPGEESPPFQYNNFNTCLRRFIAAANGRADQGELDLVLMLGDLVDFVNQGLSTANTHDNNWRLFFRMIVGDEEETARGNPGLRVPIFTTLGNHDWRPNPYPPEANPKIFGLPPQAAEKLDFLYADTDEAVGKKISDIHKRLISKGSPILDKGWWGTTLSSLLTSLEVNFEKAATRLLAVWTQLAEQTGKYLIYYFIACGALSVGITGSQEGAPALLNTTARDLLPKSWQSHPVIGLIVLLVAVGLIAGLFAASQGWVRAWLREKIISLASIECGVDGLVDYFLTINPYFNYAVRLQDCYFLILDTGHDVLTAQSFWDEGGKKIEKISIRDNIIGGSPDTMGFYQPNEYYPYSQVAWIEEVLACIQRSYGKQLAESPRRCRIIVGLHTPVINLSTSERGRADQELEHAGPLGVLMEKSKWPSGYEIRFGTVNHFLSEFFYLCLGYREVEREALSGPGVDIVLSGHAHWRMECKLMRPGRESGVVSFTPPSTRLDDWEPWVFYGNYAAQVEAGSMRDQPGHWWGPIILQTGACGPPSDNSPHTPNFRYIVVDAQQNIRNLKQISLRPSPSRE